MSAIRILHKQLLFHFDIYVYINVYINVGLSLCRVTNDHKPYHLFMSAFWRDSQTFLTCA